MRYRVGDRVVIVRDKHEEDSPPPRDRPGVIVGFAIQFPGSEDTWIVEADEIEPSAIDALGNIANTDEPTPPEDPFRRLLDP